MARGTYRFFICGLVLAGIAGAAGAQQDASAEEPLVFATGAQPVDPAVYAKLPKVQRHRAWLPRAIDLTKGFPEPGAQGASSNCVAWATGYAARTYLLAYGTEKQPIASNEIVSPAYIYNRLRPPGTLCTIGTQLLDALNLLKTEGAVSFADFPDDITKCRIPAPPELKSKASSYRLSDWRAVDRKVPGDWRTPLVLDDLKGTLARKVPIVFAMPVDNSFQNWKGSGVFTSDKPATSNWHAMALIGYDEDRQAFRIMNSWGKRWGDAGYAWVSYDTFQRYVGEAYALEAQDRTPVNINPAPSLSPEQNLQRLASTVPCGVARLDRAGGKLRVTGFAGDGAAITGLQAAAAAAGAEFGVVHRPWPQCEAETTLAAPLLQPDVKLWAQTANGTARTGDPVTMKAGELFGLSVQTTARHPYVHVVFLQADGSAVELYRGTPGGQNRTAELGTQGEMATRFQVGPPYGNEVLIALASDRPLFNEELADYQTERQFLTGLRRALLRKPQGSIAAAVLRLKTSQ